MLGDFVLDVFGRAPRAPISAQKFEDSLFDEGAHADPTVVAVTFYSLIDIAPHRDRTAGLFS